jgi:diguanylate cyclase (GGDEF)-like protein
MRKKMQKNPFPHQIVSRFIEEYGRRKQFDGRSCQMNGAELLKIIKLNEFEAVLRHMREAETIYCRFAEIEVKALQISRFKDFFDILLAAVSNAFHIPYVWLSAIEGGGLAELIDGAEDAEIIRSKINVIQADVFHKLLKNREKPVLANQYLGPYAVFFPLARDLPMRSLAVAPIYVDGKLEGSLNLGDYTSTRFDPGMDTFFVEQLMVKVSLCLSNVCAHERLHFHASHDPLTGMLNRSAFEGVLCREFNRSRRHNSDLTLIFIDIDGFKQINDRYGHECGDQALTYVGRNLEALIRREDIAGRFAGDAFVLMLPETKPEASEYLMDRIQTHLDEHPLNYMGVKLSITLTYGIASIDEKGVIRPDQLLKMADDRLFVSKGSKTREMPIPLHPRLKEARAS